MFRKSTLLQHSSFQLAVNIRKSVSSNPSLRLWSENKNEANNSKKYKAGKTIWFPGTLLNILVLTSGVIKVWKTVVKFYISFTLHSYFKLFCLFLTHLYYMTLSKQAGCATVTLGYTVQMNYPSASNTHSTSSFTGTGCTNIRTKNLLKKLQYINSHTTIWSFMFNINFRGWEPFVSEIMFSAKSHVNCCYW